MATYRTRNSNLIDQLGRGRDGRITQDCRSTLHDKLTPGKIFKVYDIKRGKKFKKGVVNYMREKKLIGPKSNYLCTFCSEFAEQLMKEKNESPIEESNQNIEINIDTDTEPMIKQCHEYSNIEELVDLLITELNNSELITNVPYSKWSKLVSLVSHKIINPKIYTEVKNITDMYKDPSILTKLDFSKYLKERDSGVVAFLEGVSAIAFDKEKNPPVKFACCVSIESIYHLRTLNLFYLPYSFLSNLLQSIVSGSKTVSAVNGKLHPGGSYPTIQSWLEAQGKEPLE